MFNHPVFVYMFVSSPIWLFVPGYLLKRSFDVKDTRLGRLGVCLQALAVLTFLLNAMLLAIGPDFWELMFHSPWALVWIIALGTGIAGVYMTDKKESALSVEEVLLTFFALSVAIVALIVVIVGTYITVYPLVERFVEIIQIITVKP